MGIPRPGGVFIFEVFATLGFPFTKIPDEEVVALGVPAGFDPGGVLYSRSRIG
jgi:hypothetical protein